MELSQPRPCGAQGAKPTNDFLSLYSPAQEDPSPSIPVNYLKTHNFLQPMEQQVGKNVDKEEVHIEKSKSKSTPTMVEHILPGGMGTYNINHISYINQIKKSQKAPKAEGIVISAAQSSSSNNNDANSNCSSYTGNGFKLWEESDLKKGQTGKENTAQFRHDMREGVMKIGVPWMTSIEQPSQPSSIHNHPSPTTTFTSLSSSHPSSSHKNQYFVNMVKSGKSVEEEDDNDEVFVIKKESSFHHKGGLSVKFDTAKHDQNPKSPRSKHSATEQRRRSKINDRFSMLRGIIPHGDQKRDKASFLLEVIEYIQFLQEKVHKYEDSYNEPPKTQPNIPTNTQNLIDSNTTSRDTIKETDQYPQSTNKPSPSNVTTVSNTQPRLTHNGSCETECITTSDDKLKDQEMMIENGTINISTIYSQGLSSALTQALKNSGVDLSHANISVQIDLGKRSNASTLDSSPPDFKENETPFVDQSVVRSRLATTLDGEGFKRLKRSRN